MAFRRSSWGQAGASGDWRSHGPPRRFSSASSFGSGVGRFGPPPSFTPKRLPMRQGSWAPPPPQYSSPHRYSFSAPPRRRLKSHELKVLYVGPYYPSDNITDEDIYNLFGPELRECIEELYYGERHSFVAFDTKDNATKAATLNDKKVVKGVQLRVTFAKNDSYIHDARNIIDEDDIDKVAARAGCSYMVDNEPRDLCPDLTGPDCIQRRPHPTPYLLIVKNLPSRATWHEIKWIVDTASAIEPSFVQIVKMDDHSNVANVYFNEQIELETALKLLNEHEHILHGYRLYFIKG